MRKLILGFTHSIIFLFANPSWAQDPLYSQFFANPLYTNPAMAGTSTKSESAAGRAILNYRNQWNGTFQSFAGSWDQGFDRIHGALGVQLHLDNSNQGIVTRNEIKVMYSLRSALDKTGQNILYSGLQLGVGNQNLDPGRLIFGDPTAPTDPGLPSPSHISYPNAAVGVLFSNPKYFAGFAVHNLLEPNVSFFSNPDVVIPRRYTFHAGYFFRPEGVPWSFQPNILFMHQYNTSLIQLGSSFNWNMLSAGGWLRQAFNHNGSTNTVMLNAGIQNNHFRLLYSYDILLIQTNSRNFASHEISLCYRWKTKQLKAAHSEIIF